MGNTKDMKVKYEYMICTWGGFYNQQYKDIHHLESGYTWFDEKKDRDLYLTYLKTIEEDLNARRLAHTLEEGYHTRVKTILHRVVKYKGKEYYSSNDLGYGFPMDGAKYIMEWKWTPGCNDWTVIEDEEDLKDVEILAEWITGATIFNRED